MTLTHRLFMTQNDVPGHGEFVGINEGDAEKAEEITEKEGPAHKESKKRV